MFPDLTNPLFVSSVWPNFGRMPETNPKVNEALLPSPPVIIPQADHPIDEYLMELISSDESIYKACLEYLNSSLAISDNCSSTTALLPTPIMTTTTTSNSYHNGGSPSELCVKTSVHGGGVMMCLASVLESLSDCDEHCVFSVRKINKLGFKSHSVLKKYFSQFGNVVAIFFLPYRYKPDTSSVRPSSMAFIRMSAPDAVESIFKYGGVHYIQGWPVTVQPFTRSC